MLSEQDKKKCGGSDVAAVLGLSRYGGPLSVYLRVVEGVEREGNEHTHRGAGLEPYVLGHYAESHEVAYRNVRVDGLREWERATVDAVAQVGGDLVVVEAKTAIWRVMDDWGEPGTDAIPDEYALQCQWYAGSLRHDPRAQGQVGDVIHVPALVGGEFGLWVVRYDAELYEGLREGVARFWRDHVVSRRPPEPTALSNDAEAIRKRYARPKAPALEWGALTPEQRQDIDWWLRWKESGAQADAKAEGYANRVRVLIGDASGIDGAPAGRVTWKQSKATQKTDWEKVARELATHGMKDAGPDSMFGELVAEHTTTQEGARPLCWRPKNEKKR